MGRLRYSINVTLDGCVHHEAVSPDEELHLFWAEVTGAASALLYGRVTYQMMEGAWRPVAETGQVRPGMPEWTVPFARSIHAARKYVVSDTLAEADWNTEIIRGADLAAAVTALKQREEGIVSLGGVTLPLALAEMDLIDEYEFVIHPVIAGRGPTLLAGLTEGKTLRLAEERRFVSGAIYARYERAA